jgi:hypothetical protein
LELLTHINLYGCQEITDNELKYLLKLKLLTSINLYGCYNITDKGIQYILEIFKELIVYLAPRTISNSLPTTFNLSIVVSRKYS